MTIEEYHYSPQDVAAFFLTGIRELPDMISAKEGEGGSWRSGCSKGVSWINQMQMRTRGRGSKYPKIFRTSYLETTSRRELVTDKRAVEWERQAINKRGRSFIVETSHFSIPLSPSPQQQSLSLARYCRRCCPPLSSHSLRNNYCKVGKITFMQYFCPTLHHWLQG